MNKIYKLIWSKVKNMWVVASELAKSHTKSPNSGIVGIASLASLESKINMDLSKGFVAGVFPMVNRPVAKLSDFKITVAAIVKNEAENVPTWVQAARSCADEIVVVDTGSTDGTVERFRDYGIECYHYEWNDDFASAKNYMISLCHGDWIVLLDGDEWFREGCDVRKAIAKHHGNPITKAIIADWICLDKDRDNAVMFSGGAVRAFRNQPDVRYFRKVHENLTINYENFVFEPEFKMYHTGYSGSVNRSKHERNLRIMRTMFDFDNGKVEYPTDWRYIEDTYAGLGEFDKALWAADKMISFGVQDYSASAWVTKFNVLFVMRTPLEEMRKQFDFCFRTVPSISGFRFLASIYYARNGRADLALDEYTEGVRMLRGPQDRVAMEHTFWRMYLPEASALVATICLESNQLESALSALYVSEQYCGKSHWTDSVIVELRRRMAVLSQNPFDKVADKALPLLQVAKRGLVAAAMASGIVVGTLGNVNNAFAGTCNLNGVASNCASGTNATVTGGQDNIASGCYSSVSGGCCNKAIGTCSSVGGGADNTADGWNSFIGGGVFNKASGSYSSITGGECNIASGESSFIAGGCCNTASGSWSSVISGECNTASGCHTIVIGGYCNSAIGVSNNSGLPDDTYSLVAGGRLNIANYKYSSVIGGDCNVASGFATLVAGGSCNTASCSYSFVGGGCCNTASGYGSSIIGGKSNTASCTHAVAVGGCMNTASGCYSLAIGGKNGIAYGKWSTAIGGGITGVSDCLSNARYSVAIGYGATSICDYEVSIGSACALVKIGGNLTVTGTRTVTDGTTTKTWSELLAGGGSGSSSGGLNNDYIKINSTGDAASVTGQNSIAIGAGHQVTGNNSGTFGDPNVINADNSYAVGNNVTIANNTKDVFVLGNNVTVNNGTAATDTTVAEGIIALGNNASVSLDNKVTSSRSSNSIGSPTVAHSVAIGDNAVVGEENAMALGYQAQANALNALASGSNAQALSEGGTVVGHGAKVNENSSFATAVGYNAKATGEASNAFGYNSYAGDKHAVAFGRNANAFAEAATAIGNNSFSGGKRSVAIGNCAMVSADIDDAVAIGSNSKSLTNYNIAIGSGSLAKGWGDGSVAIGKNAKVGSETNEYGSSTAVGGGADVQATYGTAVGSKASVTAQNSVALGAGAMATEANVVSVGKGTTGGDTPATRRIVNVTDGTSVTDAATVGQVCTVSEGNGVVLTETTNTNGSKNEAIAVKAGTNVTVDTNGVNVVGNGAVASADTGLISGGTAYSELRPTVNGNYIATANTTAQNLSALDSALKTADNTAIKNITSSGTTVTFTKGDGTTGTFTTQDNNTEYTAGNGLELTGTEFTAKAGTNVTVDNNGINVAGNGTVADGNTGLVSGGTLFTEGRVSADANYVRANNTVAGNLSALDTAVKTNADAIAQINTGLEGKANTSLDNITNDGKSVIRTNAKEAINVVGSGKATVDKINASGVDTYTVGVTVDGTVVEGNTGIVDGGTVYSALQAQKTTTDTALTGKANVALDNITEVGHNVIKSDAKAAVNAVAGTHTTISKTDVDGVDTYAVNVTTDGAVADGNTGIVTGGTVYTAVNDEKAARETADTTLQGNIDAEATARGNADTSLGTRIDGTVKGLSVNGTSLTITKGDNTTSTLTLQDNDTVTHYYGVNSVIAEGQTNTNFDGEGAVGTDSVAIGKFAGACGKNAVAVGWSSRAYMDGGLAVGDWATASSSYGTALGSNAIAGGEKSIAIGNYASVHNNSTSGIGIGNRTSIDGVGSIGIGDNAVSHAGSVVIGVCSSSSACYGIVIGRGVSASGQSGIGIGNGVSIGDSNSIGIGSGSIASKDLAVAVGMASMSYGTASVALGACSSSAGTNDISIGYGANTTDSDNIAIGSNSKSSQGYNVSLGKGAISYGSNTVALGANSVSSETDTISVGHKATDLNSNNIAYGSALTRRIVNVSDGINDSDVATVGQLNSQRIDYIGINSVFEEWTDATANAIREKYGVETQEEYEALIETGLNKTGQGAIGDNAIALGVGAVAGNANSTGLAGANTIAIGTNAIAQSYQDIAIGDNASTAGSGNKAIAIGNNTKAMGSYGVAIGYDAKAEKIGSLAIGKGTQSTHEESFAIGYDAKAQAGAAIAMGVDTISSGSSAVGIGQCATATGNDSVAIGYKAHTETDETIAIGYCAIATCGQAIAIGNSAKGINNGGVGIGFLATASGSQSTALGQSSLATCSYASALGNASKAVNYGTVAIGNVATASGDSAISIGGCSVASGNRAVAIGGCYALSTQAIGEDSVSIGTSARANVGNSVALGSNSVANIVNVLSLGKDAVGTEGQDGYVPEYTRTIQHVTAGVNDTDAVNVKQLNDQKIDYVGVNKQWTEWNSYTSDSLKDYYNVTNEEEYNALQVSDNNRNGEGAVGISSLAIGKNTFANNSYDVSVGENVHTNDSGAVSIGNHIVNDASYSVVIGSNVSNDDNSDFSIVMGRNNKNQDGLYSVVVGPYNENYATNNVVIGDTNKSLSTESVVIGKNLTLASNSNDSVLIGRYSQIANGTSNVLIGDQSKINGGSYNIAIGEGVTVKTGTVDTHESVAIGNYVQTSGNFTTALGYDAIAGNCEATAIGACSVVSGMYGSAFGYNSKALATDSTALGTESIANCQYSTAVGYNSKALQDSALAIGNCVQTAGLRSTGIGYNVNVAGTDNIAVGSGTIVVGTDNIAIGSRTHAMGTNSIALGSNSLTSDNDVLSIGRPAIGIEGQQDYTPEYTRTIQHVTAGVNDTDAVNVKQLNDQKVEYVGINTQWETWSDETADSIKSKYRVETQEEYNALVAGSNRNGEGALGVDSIAIGKKASAQYTQGIALGYNAYADDYNSLAIGSCAKTASTNSIAIGTNAEGHYNSVAIGLNTLTSRNVAVAIGESALVDGTAGVAIGYKSKVGNADSDDASRGIAIGSEANALEYDSVAIGTKASAKAYGIAIGQMAEAGDNGWTVAIGNTASATGYYAQAFGDHAQALGNSSLAVGQGATARDTYGVAVGRDSYANREYSTTLGGNTYSTGTGATALGAYAYASGDNSLASGMCANASGLKAVSLGNSAQASAENAVALGAGSVASDCNVLSLGKDAYTTTVYNEETQQNEQVDVPELTRTIQHVTAGVNDTDAVNVKQLTDAVNAGNIVTKQHYIGVTSSAEAEADLNYNGQGASGVDAVALGPSARATAESSMALGDYAKADGLRSIAVGNSAGATNDYGIAIGGLAKAKADGGIAMGTSANVTGANAVALGNSAKAEGATSYAVGQGANAKGESSIAFGTSSESVVTGVAMGHMAKATGESGVALGTATNAGKTAVAIGHGANADAEAAMALGVNASATQPTAVAIGMGSTATEANTVSFGNTSTKRRVVNIAEGVADSDAVAMSQLNTLEETMNDGLDTKANLTLNNIDDTGKTVIRDLAKGSVKVVNGTHTTVTEGTDGDAKTYAVNVTTDGEVSQNNTGIVTGGTVYDAVHAEEDSRKAADTVLSDRIGTISTDKNYVLKDNSVSDNLVVLDAQVKTNTDDITELKDLSNLTTAGETVIKNLSKGSVNVVGDGKASVVKTNVEGVDTYTVTVNADGLVADGNADLVSGGAVYDAIQDAVSDLGTSTSTNLDGKANTSLNNVTDAGHSVIKTDAKSVLNVTGSGYATVTKTDVDGVDTYDVNVSASGSVADGNTGLVTGDTVYDEVRPASDGNYIAAANTTGANLSALDTQVKANADAISNNKTHFFGVNSTNEYDMNYDGGGAQGTNSVAVGPNAWAGGENSIAIGGMSGTFTGKQATAIGYISSAVADNATAVGTSSQAVNEHATAVGNRAAASGFASTAVGAFSHASGKNSIAIGSDSYATEEDEVSFGRAAIEANPEIGQQAHAEIKRRLTHVDAGVNDTDAVNVKQLDDALYDKADWNAANIGRNLVLADDEYPDGMTAEQKAEHLAEVRQNNLQTWGEALGAGTVTGGDSRLVTGDTIHVEVRPAENGTYVKTNNTTGQNLLALDQQLSTVLEGNASQNTAISDLQNEMETKANIGLDNITDAGKTVVRDLAKESVKVVNGTNTTVTEGTDGNAKTYAVNAVTDGAVADGNTGIVTGGTVYSAIQDTIVGKANVALDNVTEAGHTVIKTDAKSAVNVTGNSDVTVTKTDVDGVDTYNVAVVKTGTVVDGNEGVVTGGTVYDALTAETRPAANGNYITTDRTAGANLTALDAQVKTNADAIASVTDGMDGKANTSLNNVTSAGQDVIRTLAKGSVKVVDGTYTTVIEGTDGDSKTYVVNVSADGLVADGDIGIVTGGAVYNALQTQASDTATALDTKANRDASNVTDAEAWGTKIATGSVTENDVRAISGDTAYRMKTALETAMNTGLDSKADNDLSNLTDAGQAVIQQKAISSVKVGDGDNTTVSSETDADGNIIYKVKANATGTVAANDTGLVDGGTVYEALENTKSEMTGNISGKADKDLGNITDAGKEVVKDLAKDSVSVESGTNAEVVKTDVDGVDTYTVNVAGNGQVAENDTGLVNGGTVYTELRPTDGNYVRKDATTAANLSALDTKIGTVANGDFVQSANTVGQNLNALDEALYDKANWDASNVGRNTVVTDDDYPAGLTDEQKAEYAANLRDYNLRSWGQALGAGTVTGGDARLITGDTLHVEVRPANSGTYVKVDKTTGENLLALDEQLSSVVNGASAQNTTINNLENEMANKSNIALDNINADGVNVVRNIAKSAVVVADGPNTTVASSTDTDGNITYRVTANATGTVTEGNTGLVDGGTVYTAIENAKNSMGGEVGSLDADGNYIRKANTVAENLVALDTQVKTNADGLAVEQMARETADTALNNRIGTLTADGNYIAENSSVSENLSSLDTAVKSVRDKADSNTADITNLKDLSNISAAGETVIKDLAKGSVKVINGTCTTVTEGTDGDTKTFAVNVDADGTVTDGNTGLVTGGTVYDALQNVQGSVTAAMADKANVSLDNLDADGIDRVRDISKAAVSVADGMNTTASSETDADGNVIYKVNVAANGSVVSGNAGIMSGGMMYDELRPADGNYVARSSTTAANLTALDAAVKEAMTKAETAQAVTGGNVVVYDSDDRSSVTLGGADGTAIHNVADGAVTADSKDAVTGGQLYTVKSAVDANTTAIAGLDTRVQDNTTAIDTLRTTVTNGLDGKTDTDLGNLTDAGKDAVRDLAKESVRVADGVNTTVRTTVDGDASVYHVDVAANGRVESGNTGIVTGDAVYEAIRDIEINASDTHYVSINPSEKDDETFANHGASGTDAVAIGVKSYASGDESVAIGHNNDVSGNETYVIGSDVNATGNNSVVLGKGSDGSLDNVVSVGSTGNERRIVHVADGELSADSKDVVNGKQLYEVREKLQNAEGIDVDKWSDALGTGSVAPDDERLVKGSTVYSAIQSTGISLSPDGSTMNVGAANNATVVDFTNSDGNGRVLQGIVTDPGNPNSAANVGYVNAIGQNIVNGVNSGLNRLDTKINKVGAGAAALASLEPMPFDDDQKWSISAAIGTYHGTQAGAVGVFYKPQDNVMLNIRGAIGNGENMGGAGLSIGLNKGAAKGLSKASMAKAMNAQANEIVAQKQLIENQQAQLDAQKAEIEELKQMVRSVVASKQVDK